MAKIGELYVEITANNEKFNKQIKDTEKKSSKAFKSIGAASKKAAKIAGAALLAMGVASTKFASDLGESVNAVNVVFGKSSRRIKEWGDQAAEQAGLSKRAFNESSAVLGTLLKKTGDDLDSVADSTIEITKRSADLASVFNKDLSIATTAVGAALRGETEPIRQFGIDVSAAAVESEALSSGLVKNKKDITESVKIQARYNLIMQQSANVAGDFAKTSDDVANSSRVLKANIENAGAEMGTIFLPVASKVIGVLRDLTLKLKEQAPIVQDALASAWVKFGSSVLTIITKLGGAFQIFGSNIKATWITAVNSIQIAFNNLAISITTNVLGAVTTFLDVAAKLPFVGEKFQEASNSVDGLKDSLVASTEAAKENNKASIDAAQAEVVATKEATAKKLTAIETEKQAKLTAIQTERTAKNNALLEDGTDAQTELEIEASKLNEKEKINKEYQDKIFELSASRIDLLEKEREHAIESATLKGESTLEIEQYYATVIADAKIEEEKRLTEEKIALFNEYSGHITSGIKSIATIAQNLDKEESQRLDASLKADIAALEKKGLTEEEFNTKKRALEKETAKKKYELELKAFNTNKGIAVIEAGIATALGVAKSLPNLILAGIVGAAGAAQVGAIISQPPPPKPAFAKGGVATKATNAIVGEAGGEVMLGMGAQGAPLIDELARRIGNNIGNGGGDTFNFYGKSMLSNSEMTNFAQQFRPYQIKENQRRGAN